MKPRGAVRVLGNVEVVALVGEGAYHFSCPPALVPRLGDKMWFPGDGRPVPVREACWCFEEEAGEPHWHVLCGWRKGDGIAR